MANDKFTVVGTNIAEKATMIWNVADMLRGPFKPHEYGLVILPMTVVKRFHDCLIPTHQAVLDTWEKVKKFAVVDGFLTKASGYQFYNTSKFNFDSLLADPENIVQHTLLSIKCRFPLLRTPSLWRIFELLQLAVYIGVAVRPHSGR